jgi:hypothetical protein
MTNISFSCLLYSFVGLVSLLLTGPTRLQQAEAKGKCG